MTENKNILEVHHLKKSFTTGKKSFTAVEDVSFSLKTGGGIRDRRGIRLRKKHCGEDDHTSDRTHRRTNFSHGKGYHTCKGKKSPGNLPGNADDFSDTGRIL